MEEFLKDIERAVSHPEARLAVYQTRHTNYAAVVSPNVVPPARRGDEPGQFVVVYYSANRGRIISAVQANEGNLRIPERARWLE